MMTIRTINHKNTAAIFLALGFLFFLFIFAPTRAQAATSTVRGIGWWGDNYQEVYFNCLDDKIGDRLDTSENLNNPPDPRGFHFYSTPCHDLVHAVYIDSNDNFSGQAWNPTKGLISFAGAATPPDNYASTNANCQHTCNASNNCWACYNEATQNVYGYARVATDNTWIRLDSGLTPAVRLQNCDLSNSVWPGYNIQSGDFVGYGSSALGNLSFNCESEVGGSACATRNYKVYISNLTVGSLSAPNWTYAQACGSTALGATLKWCKKSGTQTAYEVTVTTSNTFSTSTAVCWSGKKTSNFASQYILPSPSDINCHSLNYNSHYYWWVRLYDENDVPTDWYQYNTNSGLDTDGNPDSNALTFTTYKHEFPSPYFTWSPYEVLVGTSTLFSATSSQFYTSGAPGTPQYCSGPNCQYLWTSNDPGALITPNNTATTTIIFDLATGTTVTLKVTDLDNYYCSSSTLLRINYDLPLWREIKAR